MEEVKLTEYSLLNSIDIAVLSSPSVSDFVRSIAVNVGLTSPDAADNYFQFMDNITLFCIMSDQYMHDEAICCLMASLVYFTARQDSARVERISILLKQVVGPKGKTTAELETHKQFVLGSLQELGTRSEDIQALRTRINLQTLGI